MNWKFTSVLILTLMMTATAVPRAGAAVNFPIEGRVGDVVRDSVYTYLRVDHGEQSSWVATVSGAYRPGVQVGVQDGVAMTSYTSAELDRTFDEVVFTDQVAMRSPARASAPSAGAELPPGHPPIGHAHEPQEEVCPVSHGESQPADGMSGIIIETMDAAGYTYIQVKTDEGPIWAATSSFDAQVGDPVVVPAGMVMKNFESQSLGRTFPEIYFVETVYQSGHMPAAGKPAEGGACCPEHGQGKSAMQVDVPEGGLSVSDLYERRSELAGQKAVVRGHIVKISKNIMGKNWMHVDDGSLPGGDLTVTTTEDGFQTGEVVTLSGVVAVDVNIGPHYDYPLILEDVVEVD